MCTAQKSVIILTDVFFPKIYYNFELELYVCSDTVKVRIPPKKVMYKYELCIFHADNIFYLKSDAA